MSSGYNELFGDAFRPAKNKKIALTVDEALYGALYWTARSEAVSLQTLIRTLLHQALQDRKRRP